MAERTEELTRDIVATRERMSGTIDAIGDRVVPSRVVSRRWQSVRDAGGRVRQRVMGDPRPPYASIGNQSSGTGLSAVGSKMSDAASSAGSAVSDAASAAKDQLVSTPERVEQRTQGNPIAAGAIAFGLGVLIGSAAPPSKEEQELAELVLPTVREEAQAIASEVVDTTKSEAQDHLAQVKEEATEAVDQVKQQAQQGAQSTKDRATEAASDVGEQASTSVDQARNGS